MSRVDETSLFYGEQLDRMTDTFDEVEVWEAFSRSDVVVIRAVTNGQDVRAFADPRALRDALSAHLGEAGSFTASQLVTAKAEGYASGVETGRLVERGAMSVGLPRHVSAVEVELFREALDRGNAERWDLNPEARDRGATRAALEAVETYRAWKAGQA